MLRPGGEPHANQIGKRGVANLELEIEPGLLADYGVALTRPSIASLAPVGALAPRLRRALRLRKRVASLLVERIALEILALVVTGARSRPGPRRRRWLLRVHDRIRDEFRSDLTVTALARDAGVHPVHLARALRARLGAPPGAYRRTLKGS